MPINPVATFRPDRIDPYRNPDFARSRSINLAPGTYPKGQVLGQISSANVADVQTVTVGATGGTYRIYVPQVSQYTSALAYNASAATIQAALVALLGATTSVAVTGTGPYVVTFGAPYAAGAQPLFTIDNSLATGGTVTVAHTTTGVGPTSAYTAYASGNSDGSQTARGLLVYSETATVTTDPNDASGVANTSLGYEHFVLHKGAAMYTSGEFLVSDLTGLDAAAVTALGGMLDGPIGATGTVFKF